MKYAKVVVDIDISKLDKVFTYSIPENLDVSIGDRVNIPFGNANKIKSGYVIELTDECDIEQSRIKDIDSLSDKGVSAEQNIIALANYISKYYGVNIITSLKAITPVKIARNMKSSHNPLLNFKARGEKEDLVLTQKQQEIVDRVSMDIDKRHRTYLLYGVTGSGKTLVYIELVKKVLESNKNAIILIPEISLTYQTIERFYNIFGEKIVIMHSRLTDGEKYDQYQKVIDGKARIVIGPRSALFMPLNNIGIIIIDEEHDNSYKNEKSPRFHARDIAKYIAKKENAILLMGSATPSMESYYKACNTDEITLLKLTDRPGEIEMPDINIVDLCDEQRNGNLSLISDQLDKAINKRLEKNEQILLFLNRRGYSSYVSCLNCGKAIKCSHCDVSMTYHKQGVLICHYCGNQIKMPSVCPECGSDKIGRFKIGTEQAEDIIKQKYSNARVARMDRDTTSKKNTMDKILFDFYNHNVDILIGTQMIAKGHHFPKCTLVGVLNADISLNAEDYKSSKITFDLLSQVAGRSGRSDKKGEVIVQTYNPNHFVFKCLQNNDFEAFYNEEILYRNLLKYPPVYKMLMLVVSGINEDMVIKGAKHILTQCNKFKREYDIEILGVSVPRVSKIKDIHRRVIYCKSLDLDILIMLRRYIDKYVKINKGYNKLYLTSDIT